MSMVAGLQERCIPGYDIKLNISGVGFDVPFSCSAGEYEVLDGDHAIETVNCEQGTCHC